MKTSNKILTGFFGLIFLYIAMMYMDTVINGYPMDQIKRVEKLTPENQSHNSHYLKVVGAKKLEINRDFRLAKGYYKENEANESNEVYVLRQFNTCLDEKQEAIIRYFGDTMIVDYSACDKFLKGYLTLNSNHDFESISIENSLVEMESDEFDAVTQFNFISSEVVFKQRVRKLDEKVPANWSNTQLFAVNSQITVHATSIDHLKVDLMNTTLNLDVEKINELKGEVDSKSKIKGNKGEETLVKNI